MSQMPPPMNAPVGYAQPSTGKPTNVLAIVSLICGILGCFILTPIVGLITGFLGLAKSKVLGGKGMAIAGIVLSILWIVGGIGAIGAGYWGVGKINEAVATATVQPTIDFLNNVREDPMGMEVGLNSSLMGPEAQALSEKLKPLGKVTAVTVANPSYNNTNGQLSISYRNGTATFENGEKRPISATFETREDRLIITEIEVE